MQPDSPASIGTDLFRREIEAAVGTICNERDWIYDNGAHRGWAFQLWIAEQFCRRDQGIDTDPEDAVLMTNDSGLDIILEDPNEKVLYLIQTKFVSLAARPPINLGEVSDFFNKHGLMLDKSYVKKHFSDDVLDRIGYYNDLLVQGYRIQFYFISTGRDVNDKAKDLAAKLSKEHRHEGISFHLLDFPALKELYIETQTLEQSIPERVSLTLGSDRWLLIEKPRRTLIAVIKANSLVNLYRKEREKLFAYNIRSFLGRKGLNKDIIDTAEEQPENFFFFNNGISAICTNLDINERTNELVANKFQIINGAQTVGALAKGRIVGDCNVLLRITEGESVVTDKGFNADVIKFDNTQNLVKVSDFRSNDEIQLFLEKQFRDLKPYGTVPMISYQRKRTFKKAPAGSYALRFEELAKLRYAWEHEPTRCVADPKSLWTHREGGGVYEDALGVDGQLLTFWPEEVFRSCLAAIVFYRAIEIKIEEIKKKNAKFVFLRRLRYFALALAPIYMRRMELNMSEVIANKTKFDETFELFWKETLRELNSIHHGFVIDQDGTLFALARSESQWKSLSSKFDSYLEMAAVA